MEKVEKEIKEMSKSKLRQQKGADKGEEEIVHIEEDEDEEEEEEEKVNLMERINQAQKSMTVTAKVRGILKKLNKTYGGSILK